MRTIIRIVVIAVAIFNVAFSSTLNPTRGKWMPELVFKSGAWPVDKNYRPSVKTIPFDLEKITKMNSLKEQMENPTLRDKIDIYLNGKTTLNNRVQLLINGSNAFEKRLEMARRAKRFIFIQNLVYMDDRTGLKFLPIFAQKLEEGVIIRIMIDAVASYAGSKKFYQDLNRYIRSRYKALAWKYPQFRQELEYSKKSILIFKANKRRWKNYVIQHDEKNKQLYLESWKHKLVSGYAWTISQKMKRLLRVNHNKMFLVDGTEVIVGGMNQADNYSHGGLGLPKDITMGFSASLFDPMNFEIRSFSRDEIKTIKKMTPRYFRKLNKQWGKRFTKNYFNPRDGWRDTDIHVEGAQAGEFLSSFNRYWNMLNSSKDGINKMGRITSMKKAPNNPKVIKTLLRKQYLDGEGRKVINGVMTRKVEHIPQLGEIYYTRLMRWLLKSARLSVSCHFPYMIISKHLKKWLVDAGKRGVKIDLITNGIKSNDTDSVSGSPMTWTARKGYLELISVEHPIYYPGPISIYEWQRPTLHSKVCVVDSYAVVVGSSNHDMSGDYLASEIATTIFDNRLAQQVSKMFIKDKEYAKRITAKNLRKWYKKKWKYRKKKAVDHRGIPIKKFVRMRSRIIPNLVNTTTYRPIRVLAKKLYKDKVITH